MKKPIIFAAFFVLLSGWAAAQDAPKVAVSKQTTKKAEEKKTGAKTLVSTSKNEAKKKPIANEVVIDVSAYMKDAEGDIPPEPKKE